MQKTSKALIRIVEWLLKFFIPPMVGALILSILNEIHFFYENYDFVTLLDDTPIRIFFYGIARSFSTLYYIYYLFVYIPFFVYLIVLQKFNKLSLAVVLVSGFIYALLPLLFSAVNSLNHLTISLTELFISLALVISGLLCAATYYYLHRKFSMMMGEQILMGKKRVGAD